MKSIIVGALGIIFSFTAFCSPTNVELGQTVSIKLTSSKSICNIRVMGDGIIEDIAATAGEDVYFTYTPKETGLKRFVWEGKLKARGLKTLFPCFDSGNFEVRVVKTAEMLRAEAAEKEALLEQLKADIEKKIKADIQAEQTAKIKAEEDRKAAELRIKEEREQAAKLAAERDEREKLEKFMESPEGQKLLAEMKAADEKDRIASERAEEARLAAQAKKALAEKLAVDKEGKARLARQAELAAAERLAAEQEALKKIQDPKREKDALDKLTLENENKKRELPALRSELSESENNKPQALENNLSENSWLVEKVIGKKWPLFKDIPCNMNGGTYKVFDLNDPEIEKIYQNGRKIQAARPFSLSPQDGNQKFEASLAVQDGNKFTVRQKRLTDGDKNMVRLVGNGVVVSERIAKYELQNSDVLKYNITHTILDKNAAAQIPSQIRYKTMKEESGIFKRCDNAGAEKFPTSKSTNPALIPLASVNPVLLGTYYYHNKEYEKAVLQLTKVLEEYPTDDKDRAFAGTVLRKLYTDPKSGYQNHYYVRMFQAPVIRIQLPGGADDDPSKRTTIELKNEISSIDKILSVGQEYCEKIWELKERGALKKLKDDLGSPKHWRSFFEIGCGIPSRVDLQARRDFLFSYIEDREANIRMFNSMQDNMKKINDQLIASQKKSEAFSEGLKKEAWKLAGMDKPVSLKSNPELIFDRAAFYLGRDNIRAYMWASIAAKMKDRGAENLLQYSLIPVMTKEEISFAKSKAKECEALNLADCY